MEHRGLLSSIRVDPHDRRSPRIYSITEYGVQELIDGLKFVMERQRVNDELIKYYEENFGSEDIE